MNLPFPKPNGPVRVIVEQRDLDAVRAGFVAVREEIGRAIELLQSGRADQAATLLRSLKSRMS